MRRAASRLACRLALLGIVSVATATYVILIESTH